MGGFQNGLRGVPLVMAGLFALTGFGLMQLAGAATYSAHKEAEDGVVSGNTQAGDSTGASGGAAIRFGLSDGGAAIINAPSQPAALMYSNSTTNMSAYAKPGGMVVAGRTNYADQGFKTISAGGGTVLIYLDALIDNATGPYDKLLLNASACGAAVPRWPGSPQANTYGYLNDFRVGGVLQNKLECVLEKMVADNPHMAGWFADDLGSRSYYPGFDWDSWSASDKQAYRDGAVALSQTFRKVANKYGLVFIVNGAWNGGTVGTNGGGYPDVSQHGNALADGGFVEHHDGQDNAFWHNYSCSTQWAAQSPVTRGKAINWTITLTDGARSTFIQNGCYAFAATQTDYGSAPSPWTSIHATNLPSKVGGAVSF